MIAAVLKKELRQYVRDGRVLVLVGVLFGLGVAAALSGWNTVRAMEAERAAASAVDRDVWDNQGQKNPHTAAHFSRYAFRPITNVSVFDPGVNTAVGGAVWLEAHHQDPATLRPIEDAVEIHRFAQLSPAWILQCFAPLLLVLLVFASVAGERERGTLRHMMSTGVRANKLLWGKGLAALIVLSTLAPLLALVLAMVMASGASPLPDAAARGGLLVATYAVYLLVCLFIALAVSARSRRSKTALVVLLGFWALSAVVAPRLANNVGALVHPAPQSAEFWSALNEASSGAFWGTSEEAKKRQEAVRERALAEYGVASVEELPINYDGYMLQASEEFANEVFDEHYGALHDTLMRQRETARYFSLVSPTIAIGNISSALAGSDVAAHHHFTNAAEQFRRDFIRLLNEEMIEHAGKDGYNYQSDNAFWRQTPDFQYTPQTISEVWPRIWPDVLMLALWCLAGLSLATSGVRASFAEEATS